MQNINNQITAYTEIPHRNPIILPAFYPEFISYYPRCEMETKSWFVENVKSDWVILDAGANIGYYSIMFSMLAPSGTIYAFEPTDTFDKLLENLKFNNIANVVAHKIALGNKSGQFNDAIFKIWGNKPENLEYIFTTIDDFVDLAELDKVDAIKIDVDSFDFEVLQGAEKTLLRLDPYVMLEINQGALAKRNISPLQVFSWLYERGYTTAEIFDDENYLLKKQKDIAVKGKLVSILHTPESLGSRHIPFEQFSKTIPVADVCNLHAVLGFSAQLPYPKAYRDVPFTAWRMEVHDSPIFRYLYRNFKPHRHLEFGTWQGAGTVYCLEESDATVWTINMPFGETSTSNQNENVYNSGDSYDLQCSALHDWAKYLGFPQQSVYRSDSLGFIGRFYIEKRLGHRVCQIYSDSTKWDTTHYPDGFFDSILIDGGHSAEIVCHDTLNSMRLLRSGGLMMWHDCCPPIWREFPCTQGVMQGIQLLAPVLLREMRVLFWIQPSWILLGIKK